MVDWTVLGVAALGTVGTVGAGALGFAGPSWNDRRIQAARDRKELRQAIRLVRAELKDILSSLETRDEGAEDKFGAIAATFSLIPAPEETEWHRRREKIALLVDDRTRGCVGADRRVPHSPGTVRPLSRTGAGRSYLERRRIRSQRLSGSDRRWQERRPSAWFAPLMALMWP